VVGESGSGKSTLARLVMALDRPSEGRVELLGRNLHRCEQELRRAARLPDGVSGPLWIAGPAHDSGSHRQRAFGNDS
jgi:ABC-type thiamine transport system ATPase subunit